GGGLGARFSWSFCVSVSAGPTGSRCPCPPPPRRIRALRPAPPAPFWLLFLHCPPPSSVCPRTPIPPPARGREALPPRRGRSLGASSRASACTRSSLQPIATSRRRLPLCSPLSAIAWLSVTAPRRSSGA